MEQLYVGGSLRCPFIGTLSLVLFSMPAWRIFGPGFEVGNGCSGPPSLSKLLRVSLASSGKQKSHTKT